MWFVTSRRRATYSRQARGYPGDQWDALLVKDTRSTLGAAQAVAAAWIVILVIMLLLGWLLTHSWEPSVDPWDDAAERWLAAERTSDLNRVASMGTFLGNARVGLAVAVVVATALSVWQRSLRPAIVVGVLLAGALGLYVAGTKLITRDRPPVPILDPGLVPDHSFPSGHVISAVVVYGGTALLIAGAAPRARRWISLLLIVPLFVALARMYQGAHHPTDVLASLVLATAWVAVVTQQLLRRTSQPAGGAAAPSKDMGRT